MLWRIDDFERWPSTMAGIPASNHNGNTARIPRIRLRMAFESVSWLPV
jgi:hypothetical protein